MQGKLKTFRTNSQCKKILEYLQTGKSLTVMEALNLGFGANLRSRISNLKDAGHNIVSEKIQVSGTYIASYKLKTMNLVTCKGNGIFAIIGRDEIESYPSCDEPYNYVNLFPKDLCFISISDINRDYINHNHHFKDTLELKFWDIEEDFNDYKTITDIQAKQIYNFIIKNKDSEFLINCEAGVSRSAGVGLAIEYLLRDFELYPKWEHFPSKVLQHWRYQPNMTVFNKIISFSEVING